MNDGEREEVSALLDGALLRADTDRVLGLLSSRRDLRAAWDRYHLIGDLMRGEAVRPVSRGIADAVAERIRSEPTVLAPGIRTRLRAPRWLRPAAGGALAASVAVVAITLAPDIVSTPPLQKPVAEAGGAPAPAVQVAEDGTRWRQVDPEVESKLNQYLVDHGEYLAPGAVHRVLPYASFVSYDAGR
ncbi:MAG: sigma-E factor negative regulatory protein [Chromatiales bacterium]|jgi:sigma-E factor negative regulatory protein RseA